VRCNSVHPGIIMTPMGEGILPNEQGPAEKVRKKRIPIGEIRARREDIAYGHPLTLFPTKVPLRHRLASW